MGLLDSVLGGQAQSSGGMSPITMALLGVLAYRTFQGKGRLADMLGRKPGDTGATPTGGGLGGLLGGLMGGGTAGAGSTISGGLSDLLKHFQDAGHGDKAQSWIGTGPNAGFAQ
jgi:uncharacterized protein YidB (DUF937 family)